MVRPIRPSASQTDNTTHPAHPHQIIFVRCVIHKNNLVSKPWSPSRKSTGGEICIWSICRLIEKMAADPSALAMDVLVTYSPVSESHIYLRSIGDDVTSMLYVLLSRADDGTDTVIWRSPPGCVVRAYSRREILCERHTDTDVVWDGITAIITVAPLDGVQIPAAKMTAEEIAKARVVNRTTSTPYIHILRVGNTGDMSLGRKWPMPVEAVRSMSVSRVLDRMDADFGKHVPLIANVLNCHMQGLKFNIYRGELYASNCDIRQVTTNDKEGVYRGVEWKVEASRTPLNEWWVIDLPAFDPAYHAEANYAAAHMCRIGTLADGHNLYAFGSPDWKSLSLSDGRRVPIPVLDGDDYSWAFKAFDWVQSIFSGHPVSMPRHVRPQPGPNEMHVDASGNLIISKQHNTRIVSVHL